MLAGSDNVAADSDELTTAEREALMRVSLEEVGGHHGNMHMCVVVLDYYTLRKPSAHCVCRQLRGGRSFRK